MKAGRIAFRVLLIAVISVTLGLTVYTWNSKRVLNDQLPMPFGVGVSVVLSGSMEPELSVNDLILIKSYDTYEKGDIVVYQEGSILVVHEVIGMFAKAEDGTLSPVGSCGAKDTSIIVVTKGKANDAADDPIKPTDIKGKYVFKIPFIGLVVDFIRSLPGIVIILALSAFLMIKSWKNEKNESMKDIERLQNEINRLKGEEAKPAEDDLEAQINKLKEELGQKESPEEPPENKEDGEEKTE
ncbi:MAG: signal peptidase I [Clostridia bacterium]|nr:signal peptidase I [Clostridia bacterium]